MAPLLPPSTLEHTTNTILANVDTVGLGIEESTSDLSTFIFENNFFSIKYWSDFFPLMQCVRL